jgi:UPF0716 protein FxsA
MPVLFLLALFIVVPIVEIYVIIQVGQAIGALWTVALLIADSIAGTLLMKSQGRAAWRRFQAALAEGRAPAREVLDGMLVIFGGAFLLAPGFITDIFGALFLIPPTRAIMRRLLMRRFTFALLSDMPSPLRPGAGRRRPPPGRPSDFDVDGTAHEIDDPPRRLP